MGCDDDDDDDKSVSRRVYLSQQTHRSKRLGSIDVLMFVDCTSSVWLVIFCLLSRMPVLCVMQERGYLGELKITPCRQICTKPHVSRITSNERRGGQFAADGFRQDLKLLVMILGRMSETKVLHGSFF